MCGITGIIGTVPLTDADHAVVDRMNDALYHRGPDGAGAYRAPNVHIAMRRLSIIDLASGWQPLYNEDQSVALVCNGEIYNHVELRAELIARGHRFRTGSDCETIAHLYEEFGDRCVDKLRGMFAFALYDSTRRRVLIGRDRMGEKPMYLAERDGQILFSSELGSLLRGHRVPFVLDPAAVKMFFHYGYVPEPATPVVGVRKLPAGCTLAIELDRWKVEQRCYWRLDDAPAIEGDPIQRLRDELEVIGDLIVRADVPVGVALSGGLDSSAIAVLATRRKPGQIHALSVGYTGRPPVDERHQAQELANLLKMPFHEVEIHDREVVELFPERAAWRDDPIADIAGHGYYAVSRLARDKGIPVLLKGQGADELFWGYGWLQSALKASMQKDAQGGAPIRDGRYSPLLPDGLSPGHLRGFAIKKAGQIMGWDRGFRDTDAPPEQLIFYNASRVYQRGAAAFDRITTPDFRERTRAVNPAALFTIPRPWPHLPTTLTSLACSTYLIENGMVQGDRLSMVNSVELRLPLCDYRFAELVVGLRKANPDHHLPAKAWFREAITPLLPPNVLSRPKRGFTPPTAKWLDLLAGAYRLSLTDGYLVSKGILSGDAARDMSKHHTRASIWPETLYKCLILEWWCRAMEQAASSDSPPSNRRTPAPASGTRAHAEPTPARNAARQNTLQAAQTATQGAA
jgi:asparagine synthase (glutamine-hydrolysing)